MHSKLNLHLDSFPGTDATESGPSAPAPLMGLIYQFWVYYVKMMPAHVQYVNIMLQSQ